jgi:hypothetical protein
VQNCGVLVVGIAGVVEHFPASLLRRWILIYDYGSFVDMPCFVRGGLFHDGRQAVAGVEKHLGAVRAADEHFHICHSRNAMVSDYCDFSVFWLYSVLEVYSHSYFILSFVFIKFC